jgi:hypothetical protein
MGGPSGPPFFFEGGKMILDFSKCKTKEEIEKVWAKAKANPRFKLLDRLYEMADGRVRLENEQTLWERLEKEKRRSQNGDSGSREVREAASTG